MHTHRPRVLVIDEDRDVQTTVGALALAEGYDVASTVTAGEAMVQLRQRPAHLALVEVGRTNTTDLEVLRTIRTVDQRCRVALMSHGAPHDRIVEALTGGAVDYLRKPLDLERLRALLTGIREQDAGRRSALAAEADIARQFEFCGMVGRGPAMQGVFDLVRRLAPHAHATLISGEAGTGKQLVAGALHMLGTRRSRPLIVVDCSAVVESLFERELFGCSRDVCTGAPAGTGLIEAADGGTIVLDHIGDLPLALQARLLQVLESGCAQRPGSVEWRRVDVHVMATTERDLRRDAATGRFNAALYERLAAARIHVPALRDRRDDIAYLTALFVRSFAQRFEKPIGGLTTAADQWLREATWIGKFRELRSVLDRACALADGEFITEADLAAVLPRTGLSMTKAAGFANRAAAPSQGATALRAVECEHIIRTLEQVRGNKALAARLLGVSRRAFYRQLARHGLQGARVGHAPPTEMAGTTKEV
jgi:DNA-binding NtrC family response regulator